MANEKTVLERSLQKLQETYRKEIKELESKATASKQQLVIKDKRINQLEEIATHLEKGRNDLQTHLNTIEQ